MKDNLETVGYGLIGCAIALIILSCAMYIAEKAIMWYVTIQWWMR